MPPYYHTPICPPPLPPPYSFHSPVVDLTPLLINEEKTTSRERNTKGNTAVSTEGGICLTFHRTGSSIFNRCIVVYDGVSLLLYFFFKILLVFSCITPVTRCCFLSIISHIILFLSVSHSFYSHTFYDAIFFVHISLLLHFTTRQASQHLISNDLHHSPIILSYHNYHSGYGSDTSKNSRTRNNENTRGWNAGSGVRSGSGKYARSTYKDSGYSSAGSQVCTHVRSFFHKNFLVSYFARICFFCWYCCTPYKLWQRLRVTYRCHASRNVFPPLYFTSL